MQRFRIYLSNKQIEQDLLIDAFVYSDFSYEILFSLDKLYENILKEGLSSDLFIMFIDEITKEKKVEYIKEFNSSSQALKNISVFLKKWYNLEPIIDNL